MLILINYIFLYHLFVIIHGRDNDMIYIYLQIY
jgi:hypothetical protein